MSQRHLSDLRLPRLAICEGEYVAFAPTPEGDRWIANHANFLKLAGLRHIPPSTSCPLCGGAVVFEGDRWVCSQAFPQINCDWEAPRRSRTIIRVILNKPAPAEVRFPPGLLTTTRDAILFATDEPLIIPRNKLSGDAPATCTQPGVRGNVPTGVVFKTLKSFPLVKLATNTCPAEGGLDAPLFEFE